LKFPPFFGQVVKMVSGRYDRSDRNTEGVREMRQKRKNHSKEFKAKVALEAVKGMHTLSELAARHKVHPTQIGQWKKHLMDGAPQLFERGHSSVHPDEEKLSAPLFQEIGRLKMEVDFLQKKC